MASTTTVSLKLLIDSKANRVLFAEAGKEFVDFLFNILSLPVGTLIRLLSKEAMVGCLGNLYHSIENLDDTYYIQQPNQSKDSILNPKVVSFAANLHLFLPNMDSCCAATTSTTFYYRCQGSNNINVRKYSSKSLHMTFRKNMKPRQMRLQVETPTSTSNCYMYVTNDPNSKCPNCQMVMNQKMTMVNDEPLNVNQAAAGTSNSSEEVVGYVKGGVFTYIIMDDLVVMPMTTISSIITVLNKFNVKELVGALEEKMVELTMDEGVKMLKAALQSKHALTDVFLKRSKWYSTGTATLNKFENQKEIKQLWKMASTTVSLKLLVDTKGNRVLFAESGKDFVDFLFNILSLPVGTVIRLLTKQGMVGSLGNLYDSIENLSNTYMLPNQSKDSILNPKIVSSAANLRLLLPNIGSSCATTTTAFYRCCRASYSNCSTYVTTDPNTRCPQCSDVMNRNMKLVEPQKNQSPSSSSGQGGYVKELVTYMIMDDLVVRPMSTISSITILNKFNIKDVGALEEKVVELTMDEGVKLLKAALQSKNVLTDVFLKKKNHMNLKSEMNLGNQTEDLSEERIEETAMGQEEELVEVEN